MRYHNITKDDMLNGDGLRVVLWVAGCDHGCKGCQNPVTWDPNGGLVFDEAAKQEIFEQMEKSYIAGITFSGGDPLHWRNVEEVTAFAKELKTTPASCPAASLEVCPAPCWIISRTTFCCLSMSPM